MASRADCAPLNRVGSLRSSSAGITLAPPSWGRKVFKGDARIQRRHQALWPLERKGRAFAVRVAAVAPPVQDLAPLAWWGAGRALAVLDLASAVLGTLRVVFASVRQGGSTVIAMIPMRQT